jgi:hypothetical protein
MAKQPWCTYCGTEGDPSNPLTADHLVPKALGGTDDRENLVTACPRCNSAKSTATVARPAIRMTPLAAELTHGSHDRRAPGPPCDASFGEPSLGQGPNVPVGRW